MVRINTILSEDIVERLDNIARDEKKSRSKLLREAAKKLIEEYQHQLEEKHIKEIRKYAVDIQDRLRKKSGKWDGISEIRKWREMIK